MTKTFDNTNRGSVWGNTEKKSENAPTHTGKGNITVSTVNLDSDPKGYNTVDNIEKYLEEGSILCSINNQVCDEQNYVDQGTLIIYLQNLHIVKNKKQYF